MISYVKKLTLTPQCMESSDIEKLRLQGFDDTSISDIAQITALFNYYNRLVDGLGADLEPEHKPR